MHVFLLIVTNFFCIYVTEDPKKTELVIALDGAKERLHLFEADLMTEGAFAPVVNGCEGVFHTASLVFLWVSNPQVHIVTFL